MHATDTTMKPHSCPTTRAKRKRRTLFAIAGLVGLGAAWALFRPELLFIDQKVNESLPEAMPAASIPAAPSAAPMQKASNMVLASGMFHSGAHETKGTATIHELGDGRRVLRLTGFETSNGPDVHVKLVAAADAKDDATVKQAGSIDLGSLKGNVGDQNYEIPADADLAKHRAVTIWCQRFGVNFGTAPLTSGPAPKPTHMVVATGMFHSGAHETKGTATIHELSDGRRVLRLTGFETSNGPDVHVKLVAAADAKDDATVKEAGSIDLGSLKGNVGDQNYEIPAAVDLAKHRAVTIWCQRFGVNFGTAPLASN